MSWSRKPVQPLLNSKYLTGPFEVNRIKLSGVRSSKWGLSIYLLEHLQHRNSAWLCQLVWLRKGGVFLVSFVHFVSSSPLPWHDSLHHSLSPSAFLNQILPPLISSLALNYHGRISTHANSTHQQPRKSIALWLMYLPPCRQLLMISW